MSKYYDINKLNKDKNISFIIGRNDISKGRSIHFDIDEKKYKKLQIIDILCFIVYILIIMGTGFFLGIIIGGILG